MLAEDSLHRSRTTAEVLLWQSGFRVRVVLLLVVSWIVFRLALGMPDPDSLGRRWLGEPWHLAAMAVAAALYCAGTMLLRRWLQRRGRAGRMVLAGVVVGDTAVLFAALVLMTPPASYERGLLLSFFSLQLTQLYFGRRLAVLMIGMVACCYVALLATAMRAGVPLLWARELWTLYIYLLGAAGFLVLQGSMSSRLARLVQVFRRAEEGDFTETYDVAADRRVDDVTLAGRAYNRMRAQLATIVLTDRLSGCLNRRGFDDQLAREVARAARSGEPISLLAIDIDHFKQLNDSFGHLAGDLAIQEIGQLLRESARTGDVVARIGGEEFMLLAPATDAAGAAQLAERLVDAFRRRSFSAVKGRRAITTSIGVVTECAPTEGIGEDLRARADEALYAAKRSGRDRVVVWTPGLQAFTTGTFSVPA